jgi:hypothetical protein
MAGQGVVVHHVAGGHVTMMERPNVVPLVEQLRTLLAGEIKDAIPASRRENTPTAPAVSW